MKAIRPILAITWKELQVLAKDRGSLIVLFLMPLLLASMMGSMNMAGARSAQKAATGAQVMPTVELFLINQDRGPYGAQVAAILKGIDVLAVEETADVDEADQQLARGQTRKLAAVVIPADFSRKVDAYEQSAVQVIVDPAKQEFAGIVTGIMNSVVAEVTLQGEISHGIREVMSSSALLSQADPGIQRAIEGQSLGAIMTQLQTLRQKPAISVVSEDLAGAAEKKAWNPFAWEMPAFTVLFAFFLVSTVAGSLWTEKEGGMYRRLLSAPLTRAQIIAGKILGYMIVVTLQVILMFGVGKLAFDMPLGNSPISLVLITLSLAFVATSLGMLVAALARSAKQADSLGVLLGFLLGAVGGCIMPFFSGNYGSFMKMLSQITPHAHALQAYLGVLENGAGVAQIWPQLLALTGFGALFFGLSTWRLRLN